MAVVITDNGYINSLCTFDVTRSSVRHVCIYIANYLNTPAPQKAFNSSLSVLIIHANGIKTLVYLFVSFRCVALLSLDKYTEDLSACSHNKCC